MTDSLPKLLTPPEVQQVLRISERTFYRFIKIGKLRANRIHGQLRVSLPEVQRFIDSSSTSRPLEK